jgi:hypothetical protein
LLKVALNTITLTLNIMKTCVYRISNLILMAQIWLKKQFLIILDKIEKITWKMYHTHWIENVIAVQIIYVQ